MFSAGKSVSAKLTSAYQNNNERRKEGRKGRGMSHLLREMEHAYTVLDEATGTEAVMDEAGSVIIFGFHDKHTELMTRVTLDAKEASQLLQWLADYHRDFR